jgi:deoxyribodipyrimidine photo-lyase
MEKVNAFWFRRDLRLEDNAGLYHALRADKPVLAVFIFDTDISGELPQDDHRIGFIYQSLSSINQEMEKRGSSLLVTKGKPVDVWKQLITQYDIETVFTNHDYEPYAIRRDAEIKELLGQEGIGFLTFKDQVIFEKSEVVKADGKPYTVFTPFKNQWLRKLGESKPGSFPSEQHLKGFLQKQITFPSFDSLGFTESPIKVRPFNYKAITEYDQHRDYPSREGGSYFGPYLRFGLISIRQLVDLAISRNETYLSELIWREFFMQILYHFPKVVNQSFKARYDKVPWRHDRHSFERWCNGTTGYPLVDAGMRELNQTGYMHNRVRMITASFLCKHLLIDWRWGEAYFARKLFDYELSSNNGNWQWSAGTGCDASPYFRVFNPFGQQQKFDKDQGYVKKWIEEFGTPQYPEPMIDHPFARKRAIETYKEALTPGS